MQQVVIGDTVGTISGLKSATEYTFYLRAYNSHGASIQSERVRYSTGLFVYTTLLGWRVLIAVSCRLL